MTKLFFCLAVVIGLFIAGAIVLPQPTNAGYWGCSSWHTVGCDDAACGRGEPAKACTAQCDDCSNWEGGECGGGCPCSWSYMEGCPPAPTSPPATPTPTPTPSGGTIYGALWDDLNLNGQWDLNEPALGGIKVCVNPGVLTCYTTDSTRGPQNRNYTLSNIVPGNHTVVVDVSRAAELGYEQVNIYRPPQGPGLPGQKYTNPLTLFAGGAVRADFNFKKIVKPTPPPPTCTTPPEYLGLVTQDPDKDCTCPLTGPLTEVPLEGPNVDVHFQGSCSSDTQGNGSCIPAPEPGMCDAKDPRFDKGEWVTVAWKAAFSIKNLESVFAKYIGDDLESDFQNATLAHQKANLLGLTSSEWNNYNGPIQKLVPKIIFNQKDTGLRVDFIRYVLFKPQRSDAQFTYTDIYGQGDPITVAGMVKKFWDAYSYHDDKGIPEPPTDDSSEEQKRRWQDTWGLYWDKLPVAKNEKVGGELGVALIGELDFKGNFQAAPGCPNPKYKMIVPEYFRTNLLSAVLNQTLLPKIAQSPLADDPSSQSLTQGDSTESCGPHADETAKAGRPSLKDLPVEILASAQTAESDNTPQDVLNDSQSTNQGEVLGEILDIEHGGCHTPPPPDPDSAKGYCLPGPEKIALDPPQDDWDTMYAYDAQKSGDDRNTIFVCAEKKCKTVSPAEPPPTCDPRIASESWWATCIPIGWNGFPAGWESAFQCQCSDPINFTGCTYVFQYPQPNSTCQVEGTTCWLEPGQKDVNFQYKAMMRVPYLESVWNKSTSNRDNIKSGFYGFFAPPVDNGTNTSVLLNQSTYEKHALTPDREDAQNYPGRAWVNSGNGTATYRPPGQGTGYPDFVAGVKNALNWVDDALWPF